MPLKRFVVLLKGQDRPTFLTGAEAEETDDKLLIKDADGEVVGSFHLSEVQGWHTGQAVMAWGWSLSQVPRRFRKS